MRLQSAMLVFAIVKVLSVLFPRLFKQQSAMLPRNTTVVHVMLFSVFRAETSIHLLLHEWTIQHERRCY